MTNKCKWCEEEFKGPGDECMICWHVRVLAEHRPHVLEKILSFYYNEGNVYRGIFWAVVFEVIVAVTVAILFTSMFC